jgi:hypothetical protein
MTIDFNQQEKQQEFKGPIPPGSAVKVRFSIREPKENRQMYDQGSVVPLVTMSSKGDFGYLDVEMEVVSGTYKGNKIWENFGVIGTTEGQQTAVRIAMSRLRAVVEAARNVMPDDSSPQAAQARTLNSWQDLQGVEIGIIVGAEVGNPSKDGKRYINNTLRRVITPDKDEYMKIMAGEEIITDNPLPELPKSDSGGQKSPTPSWGPQGQSQGQSQGQGQGQTRPQWGGNTQAGQAAPPPRREDDVPY